MNKGVFMICVFVKNVFINFWHNDEENTGNWIERAIAGFGWNPADVKVIKFYASRSDTFVFNEQCQCIKMKPVSVQTGVDVEGNALFTNAMQPELIYDRKIIYSGGKMVNEFEIGPALEQ